VRSPQIIYNRKVSARDTKIMNIKVVLEPSDEGGYTVYVPSLSGCISEGETIDEALANIQEAIEFYLEPMADELRISEGAIVRELVL
jgi:predicted RNase H-like HicB family nuclease